MSDLIGRQAAIDALAEMYCKSDEDGYVWIIRIDACKRIDALPSIDAVEVVRCKDCVMERTCQHTQYLGEDGYCSHGERREG